MMLSSVIEAILMAAGVEHDPPIVRRLGDVIAAGAWTSRGVDAQALVTILGDARSSVRFDFVRQCSLAGALIHATRRD